MRLKTLAVLVLTALLGACGGGGGTGINNNPAGPTAPAAPSQLTLKVSGVDEITLTWVPSPGSIEGYELEGRLGSGSFEKLHTGLIPNQYIGLILTFSPTAPDNVAYAFRLRAARGGEFSSYTNEVAYTRGPNAPGQIVASYDLSTGAVSLAWDRNTTGSDGLFIERAECSQYGAVIGSWVSLPVTDPLAASYLDVEVPQDRYFVYRATNLKGGSSSQPGQASAPVFTGLPAPGQPTAGFDFISGGMNVSWTRNTTLSDSIKIERIETTSSGSQVGSWIGLNFSDPTASSFLDTTVATNTYYSYRVTNLRGGVSSAASTPSYPALAGLNAPIYLSVTWDAAKKGVNLYWASNASYDTVRLERTTCDAAGQPTGTWNPFASLPGASSTCTDLTTQEITAYLYRISGTRGTYTSPTVSAYPITTPLSAPSGLTAVPAPGGLKLTWQNQSLAATQVTVRRSPGIGYSNDIAVLPSSATTYLDPVSSLGYYTYSVVAKAGAFEAYSQPATTATPNPPDALVLTTTSLKNCPNAIDAALRPSGTWAIALFGPFGIRSDSDPWPAYFPTNFWRVDSTAVLVDKSGWPHAIYAAQSTTAGESLLIHLWFDGTNWKTENLISAKIPWGSANPGWTYRLDASGNPHVLVDHETASQPNGESTSTLSYLHKVGGAWVEEPLAALSPSVSNFGTYHLSLDASDTPHVLIGNWTTVIDYVRSGAGTWSSTTIPTDTVYAGTWDFLDSFWIDDNNGWLFYENLAGSAITYSLNVVQKKGGVWQAPVLLGSRESDAASTTAVAAIAPDHSRVAVLYKTSAGIKCYHQAPDGWHETLVAPNSASYPSLWMEFDGNQKVHILQWFPTGDFTEYHE